MNMRSSLRCPIFNVSKFLKRTMSAVGEGIDVQRNVSLKSWKEIPGPKCLPIIGTMHHFLPGGKLYKLSGKEIANFLYDNYGPISRLNGIIGMDPYIFLVDAESSSQILRGENLLPVRIAIRSIEHYRKHIKKNQNPGRPTGLTTDHGELWKELRTTVNPVLLQPKTIKPYASVLDEVAMEMITRLKSIRDENNIIQGKFDEEMNKWSLETSSVVAFGCRLNCLDPNLPDDSPVKKLMQCVRNLFVVSNELELRPNIWKWYTTPTFKRAMKLNEELENLSKIFIDRAVHDIKIKAKTDDKKVILEKLLEINEEFALIMASDMLTGGVDTISVSVTGALYLLATNPEKQNKLREEVLSNPENRPYLRATIKEALRMMPVTPGNIRRTTKEYNIMGYKIPSGMDVIFRHEVMSLMEEHFHRANEFLPERWIADKDDPLYHRNAHPFAYNPFGYGVRSCIGRRIAELQMETFLARVVENFHVEWFGEPPKVEQTIINFIEGPYNFIFNDVKK